MANVNRTNQQLHTDAASTSGSRVITHRTRGHGHGPITRLMSPSDLGQLLKPFVFLDIFNAEGATLRMMGDMPIHPHSGIATVTVFTKGWLRFDDPSSGKGILTYGGVEWMRASSGVWHGKELSPGENVQHIQGFQLWLALPPELENQEPESHYIEAANMKQAGPATVILGTHENTKSPVPAPEGINYLMVTLKAGERWIYQPPKGHTVGWMALAQGALDADSPITAGEMVVFEEGEAAIPLQATGAEDAVFVIGSAVPHPHPLHLGYYSVHTSKEALRMGELRIADLGRQLKQAGDRRTSAGTVPVYR